MPTNAGWLAQYHQTVAPIVEARLSRHILGSWLARDPLTSTAPLSLGSSTSVSYAMGTTRQQLLEAELAELGPEDALVAFRSVGGTHFARDHVKEYVLQEKLKSWSGNSFKIHDEKGDVEFSVKGKFSGFTMANKLFNADGSEQLGCTVAAPLSWRGRRYICDAEKNALAVLQMPNNILFNLTAKADVWILPEATPIKEVKKMHVTSSRLPDFTFRGDWRAKHYLITRQDGAIVGKLYRSERNFRAFLGSDTYRLTLSPHIDSALFILLSINCDQLFHDPNGA